MALLQNVIARGTHAARPAAGSAGTLYFETDTGHLCRDNGTSWDTLDVLATAPAVRCYNSAAISAASSAATALTFDTNRYDQGTSGIQHSTSSNTSRLTCQVAGIYTIIGMVSFAVNTTGMREVYIRLNGSTQVGLMTVEAVTADGVTTDLTVVTHYSLAVNDYVELVVNQTSGVTLNVVHGSNYSPEFMMARIA